MVNLDDLSWWIAIIHHDESQCRPERIPSKVVMALFAVGAINKCHTSIHGAHGMFPGWDPQNGNCNSQGVITKNSWVHIPTLQPMIVMWSCGNRDKWRIGAQLEPFRVNTNVSIPAIWLYWIAAIWFQTFGIAAIWLYWVHGQIKQIEQNEACGALTC